jgi:hypothetical protein
MYTACFSVSNSITLYFVDSVFYGFRVTVRKSRQYFLKQHKSVMFVMEKYCVFISVDTGYINVIQTSFDVERLNKIFRFPLNAIYQNTHSSLFYRKTRKLPSFGT